MFWDAFEKQGEGGIFNGGCRIFLIVMKMGKKVPLFHNSNVAAQEDIAVNDVLPVYRSEGKSRQEKG